jgi:hypothetical protein
MTRRQAWAALVLATAVSSGCSTHQPASEDAADPVGTRPTAPTESTASSPLEERWACSPDDVHGFATDPVVYPATLSPAEVAARLDGRAFELDRGTGGSVTVAFQDEHGLVERRLKLEWSEDVGWRVERGRACWALAPPPVR